MATKFQYFKTKIVDFRGHRLKFWGQTKYLLFLATLFLFSSSFPQSAINANDDDDDVIKGGFQCFFQKNGLFLLNPLKKHLEE